MELARIEKTLEAYFEGETTLEQEASLRDYFTSADVAPHLAAYQSLFMGLKASKEEVSEREIVLPEVNKSSNRWRYSIAASIVVVFGIASLLMPGNQLTTEEQEALTAFNNTKETLLMLSKNFNKGTDELAVIGQFTNAKNYILK